MKGLAAFCPRFCMRSLKRALPAAPGRRASRPPFLRRLRSLPSSPRLRMNCPMKYATSATAPAMQTSMISWSFILLTLERLDADGSDPADQEEAEEHEKRGNADEEFPLRRMEQKPAAFGVECVA